MARGAVDLRVPMAIIFRLESDMKLNVVAMFDKAAGVYGQPFVVAAVGQAIRSFQDQVNRVDDQNVVNRHPADFELYRLGYFDDGSGRFDNTETAPELLVAGSSLRHGGV